MQGTLSIVPISRNSLRVYNKSICRLTGWSGCVHDLPSAHQGPICCVAIAGLWKPRLCMGASPPDSLRLQHVGIRSGKPGSAKAGKDRRHQPCANGAAMHLCRQAAPTCARKPISSTVKRCRPLTSPSQARCRTPRNSLIHHAEWWSGAQCPPHPNGGSNHYHHLHCMGPRTLCEWTLRTCQSARITAPPY
jgi:hypothetical protein